MTFKAPLLVLALTAAAGVRASVTNTVDAIALGRIGTGFSSDGWTVTSVSNYAESKHSALRLSDYTSAVVSPVFETGVLQVKLRVNSSSAGARRLAATPIRNGKPVEELQHVFDPSPTKDRFVYQTADWPAEARVHAFMLHLVGKDVTGWAVWELSVVRADRVPPLVIVVR